MANGVFGYYDRGKSSARGLERMEASRATFPHGQRTHLTLAGGFAQVSIRDLSEDRMHDLWMGTNKELSHWHNGHNTGRCRDVEARS